MGVCMCSDDNCVKFEECYRAQRTPHEFRQSYFMWNPEHIELHILNGCEYFWPLPNEDV